MTKHWNCLSRTEHLKRIVVAFSSDSNEKAINPVMSLLEQNSNRTKS
jgi:hypothetical protein